MQIGDKITGSLNNN